MYVPDDGELKQIFQGPKVSFAWRPEKDSFFEWEVLYRALGLPYLSESVSISLHEGVKYDITSDQPEYLTDSAKVLIMTWIRVKRRDDYQRIVNKQIIDSFLSTMEARTSSLKVIYSLGEQKKEIECESYWDKTRNVLLLANDSGAKAKNAIKNAIARTLAHGLMFNRAYKDMADWIELVLGETDWEWRLKQKSWRISEEIRMWIENRNQKKPLLETGQSEVNPKPAQEADQSTDLHVPTGLTGVPTFSVSPVNPSPGHTPKGPMAKTNPAYAQEPKKATPSPITFQSDIPDLLHNGIDHNGLDLDSEIKKAFNRPGVTSLRNRPEPGAGISLNPERRRQREAEEHEQRRLEEPDPDERHRKTERTILEGPDEQVRKTLEEWYGGRCQICGKTFPKRSDGLPFFIADYIVSRKLARQCDTYANALCLCAEHFAKWQHGVVEAEDIIDQIMGLKLRSEDDHGNLHIKIRLCGDECLITFSEKHVIALQEMLNVSRSKNFND